MTENLCPSCHRPLPPEAPGGLCPVCVLMGAREPLPAAGAPSLEEVRAALPQFEVLECIGRGGMGAVYKVRQPHLDRLLALKILLPGLGHDPGFAERFTREARALAKLSHPNIVAVHDFGETGGLFWLTMEYVEGLNLRQAMQAARFTPAQALSIIPELCAALQFAHDHGVLHRDIKPENILLDPAGRVKVADFGIARMVGEEDPVGLTLTGAALGSAAYVAPEQIENPRAVDHRADLYSMGVVFYEMLTGELPLGRFAAPSQKAGSDPRLDEVVFRSLEKEREKRYQQAAEFSNQLSGAASPPAEPESVSRPPAWQANLAACLTGFSLLLGLPVLGLLCYARIRGEGGGLGGQELLLIFFAVVIPALLGMGVAVALLLKYGRSAGRRVTMAALSWPAAMILAMPVLIFSARALFVQVPLVLCLAIVGGALWWESRARAKAGGEEGMSLAWLVPASTGLLLAGGAALLLGLLTHHVLFAIPGASLLVVGLAGAWWAIGRMRAGHLPAHGWRLLRVLVAWLPALGIGALLLVYFWREPVRLFHGKGDTVANLLLGFVACFGVAFPLFAVSHLPAGQPSRLRKAGTVVALLAMMLALIVAKREDGHWPATGYYRVLQLDLPEPKSLPAGSASTVEQAMIAAAGPYQNRISMVREGAGERWRVGLIARDREAWREHQQAFLRRLSVALPAETVVSMRPLSIDAPEFHALAEDRPPSRRQLGSLLLIGLAAILGAWAAAPLATALATIVVASVLLLLPRWGAPAAMDRRMLEGGVLPPLAPVAPPADFSTPVKAAQSVFDAGWAGDEAMVRQGLATPLRDRIEQLGKWPVVMEHLRGRVLCLPHGDTLTTPPQTQVMVKSLVSAGALTMVQEAGEWRLAELPLDLGAL